MNAFLPDDWSNLQTQSEERRENAARAFARTWYVVVHAVEGLKLQEGDEPHRQCALIVEELLYLEGLTWVLGLGPSQRRSLASLRSSIEDLHRRRLWRRSRGPNGDVEVCRTRLAEAKEAIEPGQWARGSRVALTRRLVEPGATISVVVVDRARSSEIAGRLSCGDASSAEIAVVGTATTARDGTTVVDRHDPDVIVVGMALPDAPGPGAVHALRLVCPTAAVVAIAALTREEDLLGSFRAGASAFLTYDSEDQRLVEIIRRSAMGEWPIWEAIFD